MSGTHLLCHWMDEQRAAQYSERTLVHLLQNEVPRLHRGEEETISVSHCFRATLKHIIALDASQIFVNLQSDSKVISASIVRSRADVVVFQTARAAFSISANVELKQRCFKGKQI